MRLGLTVALVMLAFAGNSLLNRAALAGGEIGPMGFAALRLVSGALALCALVWLRNGRLVVAPARVGDAAALAVYVLGFAFAYLWLDAGVGAVILFGTVQITMFLGGLARGEALPLRRWIGAGAALAGLVWLLWPAGEVRVPPEGAALMAAAGLGWGIYSLRGRSVGDATSATALNFALAAPLAMLAMAWFGAGEVTARGVVLALASGIVTSGGGYALWYDVLPKLKASIAAVAQLTVPVITLLGGLMLLGEVPGIRVLAATAVVLGGVALAIWPKRGH